MDKIDQIGTIALTINWQGFANVIEALLRDGTDTGRIEARKELRRMAMAADYASNGLCAAWEAWYALEDRGGVI